MRLISAVLGAMLVALSLHAADPADEVRQTEIAFARAFADRDAPKFFAYVTDDATFIGPKRILSGKSEVTKVWSKLFEAKEPPFSWAPERVVTNAKGDLGVSTGPVKDARGEVIGFYSSVWQKQNDGSWKLVFDGPGAPAPCPAPPK